METPKPEPTIKRIGGDQRHAEIKQANEKSTLNSSQISIERV